MRISLNLLNGYRLIVIFLTGGVIAMPGCITPKSEQSPLQTGNQFARDGLYHEAATEYRSVINKNPRDLLAHRNLGIVSVKLNDFPKAIHHLEQSIEAYRDNFDANYYLAEAYRATNNYAKAIFRYQNALLIRPQDPKSLKALSWSYFRIRYYSEASETAEKLVRAYPKDPQAFIILARVQIKLKKFTQAMQSTNRARAYAQEKWIPYIRSVQGDAFFELKQIDNATKMYSAALRAQPLLAGALLGLGRCLMIQGHHDQAIENITKAVRIRPQMAEGYLALAQAYEKADPKKAMIEYRNFAKQAANDPEYFGIISDVEKRVAILNKSP